jgi:Fe-S cluster assembly iron-binding protein IscA
MINFKVTQAAKEMLTTMIRRGESEHGYKTLIPAILWMGNAEGKNFEWGIGYYERSRIASDWIITLDGVAFYLDPVDLSKLDGHTLDYINNKFKIMPPERH